MKDNTQKLVIIGVLLLVATALVYVFVFSGGEEDDGPLETIRGLQEENSVLRDEIARLKEDGGQRETKWQVEKAALRAEIAELRIAMAAYEKAELVKGEVEEHPHNLVKAMAKTMWFERGAYIFIVVGLLAVILANIVRKSDKRKRGVAETAKAAVQVKRGEVS